jgi:hypothetical protein
MTILYIRSRSFCTYTNVAWIVCLATLLLLLLLLLLLWMFCRRVVCLCISLWCVRVCVSICYCGPSRLYILPYIPYNSTPRRDVGLQTRDTFQLYINTKYKKIRVAIPGAHLVSNWVLMWENVFQNQTLVLTAQNVPLLREFC